MQDYSRFCLWTILALTQPIFADADQYLSANAYQVQLDAALVWEDRDTASFDFVQVAEGPQELQASLGPDGQLLKPTIECEFKEPKVAKVGGKSAKFECNSIDPIGGKAKRKLKVKYDPAFLLPKGSPLLPPQGFNGEVYSEVAASRLLTALGFKTDSMFPVSIICRNCPEEPFSYITKPELRASMKKVERLLIPAAAIEIKAAGEELGVPVYGADQEVLKDEFGEDVYQRIGWGMDEIRRPIAATVSSSEALPREALVMLLGWLQHADNKANNQRLLCTEWTEAGCQQSYLVAQDLGALWGKGVDPFGELARFRIPRLSKFTYNQWAQTPVWRDAKQCLLKVNTIPFIDRIATQFTDKNTFENKQFSREARDFLSSRLALLSDAQLNDLFTVAQVDLRGESYRSFGLVGPSRKVSVQDWVNTFKAKRKALQDGSCLTAAPAP